MLRGTDLGQYSQPRARAGSPDAKAACAHAGAAPALAARHDVAVCLNLFGLALFER
jgi:hypothetical protein